MYNIRHEPPVTAEPFEIIESNEDVIVINKHSSIPVSFRVVIIDLKNFLPVIEGFTVIHQLWY
jgi:hypothetical protein